MFNRSLKATEPLLIIFLPLKSISYWSTKNINRYTYIHTHSHRINDLMVFVAIKRFFIHIAKRELI